MYRILPRLLILFSCMLTGEAIWAQKNDSILIVQNRVKRIEIVFENMNQEGEKVTYKSDWQMFDSLYRKIEEYGYKGHYSYHYNRAGQLVNKYKYPIRNRGKKWEQKWTYLYDKEGRLEESDLYFAGYRRKYPTYYTYNELGYLHIQEEKNDEKWIFTYHDTGQIYEIIEEQIYSGKQNVRRYDKCGNLVYLTHERGGYYISPNSSALIWCPDYEGIEGVILDTILTNVGITYRLKDESRESFYTFDKEGKKQYIKEHTFSEKQNIEELYEAFFNDKEQLIKTHTVYYSTICIMSPLRRTEYVTTYTYYENGLLKQIQTQSLTDSTTYWENYTYEYFD